MSIAFDRAAGYYDETRGIPAEVEEQAADRVEAAVGPTGHLLEVGVGTGRVSLPLHRRGRDLVGIDLSGPMLDRYRAKAAAAGLPAPVLLRGDATRLPLRDACVDAVLEVHVLHLVPDWERALAEARRVLAPGGVVLIGRGSSHRGREGPRAETLRRFDQLARALGGGPRAVGTGDDSTKVAGLVALGGTAEPLEPVVWEQRETYGEALAAIERRVFSHAWRLPDEIFQTATRRLRAEIEAAHPDLDRPQEATHEFTLTAVRF